MVRTRSGGRSMSRGGGVVVVVKGKGPPPRSVSVPDDDEGKRKSVRQSRPTVKRRVELEEDKKKVVTKSKDVSRKEKVPPPPRSAWVGKSRPTEKRKMSLEEERKVVKKSKDVSKEKAPPPTRSVPDEGKRKSVRQSRPTEKRRMSEEEKKVVKKSKDVGRRSRPGRFYSSSSSSSSSDSEPESVSQEKVKPTVKVPTSLQVKVPTSTSLQMKAPTSTSTSLQMKAPTSTSLQVKAPTSTSLQVKAPTSTPLQIVSVAPMTREVPMSVMVGHYARRTVEASVHGVRHPPPDVDVEFRPGDHELRLPEDVRRVLAGEMVNVPNDQQLAVVDDGAGNEEQLIQWRRERGEECGDLNCARTVYRACKMVRIHESLLAATERNHTFDRDLRREAIKRLRASEVENCALRKKVQEQEDNFKIEWEARTMSVLKDAVDLNRDKQLALYDRDYEEKVESHQAIVEAQMNTVDEHRRRLAEENTKLLEDRNNLARQNQRLKAENIRQKRRVVYLANKGGSLKQIPSFDEIKGQNGKIEKSMEMLDFVEEYRDILEEEYDGDEDGEFEDVGGANDVSSGGDDNLVLPSFGGKRGHDFFSRYCIPPSVQPPLAVPSEKVESSAKVENPPSPPIAINESSAEENNSSVSGIDIEMVDAANVFDGSELADCGYKVEGKALLAIKDSEVEEEGSGPNVPLVVEKKEEVKVQVPDYVEPPPFDPMEMEEEIDEESSLIIADDNDQDGSLQMVDAEEDSKMKITIKTEGKVTLKSEETLKNQVSLLIENDLALSEDEDEDEEEENEKCATYANPKKEDQLPWLEEKKSPPLSIFSPPLPSPKDRTQEKTTTGLGLGTSPATSRSSVKSKLKASFMNILAVNDNNNKVCEKKKMEEKIVKNSKMMKQQKSNKAVYQLSESSTSDDSDDGLDESGSGIDFSDNKRVLPIPMKTSGSSKVMNVGATQKPVLNPLSSFFPPVVKGKTGTPVPQKRPDAEAGLYTSSTKTRVAHHNKVIPAAATGSAATPATDALWVPRKNWVGKPGKGTLPSTSSTAPYIAISSSDSESQTITPVTRKFKLPIRRGKGKGTAGTDSDAASASRKQSSQNQKPAPPPSSLYAGHGQRMLVPGLGGIVPYGLPTAQPSPSPIAAGSSSSTIQSTHQQQQGPVAVPVAAAPGFIQTQGPGPLPHSQFQPQEQQQSQDFATVSLGDTCINFTQDELNSFYVEGVMKTFAARGLIQPSLQPNSATPSHIVVGGLEKLHPIQPSVPQAVVPPMLQPPQVVPPQTFDPVQNLAMTMSQLSSEAFAHLQTAVTSLLQSQTRQPHLLTQPPQQTLATPTIAAIPGGPPTAIPILKMPMTTDCESNNGKASSIGSDEGAIGDEEEGELSDDMISEEYDSPKSPSPEDKGSSDGSGMAASRKTNKWTGIDKILSAQAKACLENLMCETETALKTGKIGNDHLRVLKNLPAMNIVTALFDILFTTGNLMIEGGSETMEGGVMKPISKLILIIQKLQEFPELQYEDLPRLFHEYLVEEIIPRSAIRFMRVERFRQVGQFYGVLHRTFKIERGIQDILFQLLYHRPPDAQPLMYEILKMDSTYFYEFDFGGTVKWSSLKDRVAMFCLMRPPTVYKSNMFSQLELFLKTSLLCKPPGWTLRDLFQHVSEAISSTEHSMALDQVSSAISLICRYWGQEAYELYGHQLRSFLKTWGDEKVSDGVYAAILKCVGEILGNPLRPCTAQQFGPIKSFFEIMAEQHLNSDTVNVAATISLTKIEKLSSAKQKQPNLQALFPGSLGTGKNRGLITGKGGRRMKFPSTPRQGQFPKGSRASAATAAAGSGVSSASGAQGKPTIKKKKKKKKTLKKRNDWRKSSKSFKLTDN